MVFENYKSLDESSPSGIIEVFRPSTGSPAPALLPAVKLYTLLNDILSPEAQLKLCSYFQVYIQLEIMFLLFNWKLCFFFYVYLIILDILIRLLLRRGPEDIWEKLMNLLQPVLKGQ